jgi:predicted RNase H-like HicB family nuclease
MQPVEFDAIVFQEATTYVAHCPELDVSSCGDTLDQARQNLKTAVRLFLEEAEKLGTLEDILQECSFQLSPKGVWISPRLVSTEVMQVGV